MASAFQNLDGLSGPSHAEAVTEPSQQESGNQLETKQKREVAVAVLEEHLAAMEKISLVLAHSVQRQRKVLEKLKALEGWDWQISAASALFGDAVLYRECEVALLPRDPADGVAA